MYFIHLYRLMQCRSLLLYHFKSCNRYISYEFIGPELCVNLALQCRPRPFSIRSDGLPSYTHTHNGHCTVTLWASLPSMCMPETHGHYRYSLVSSLHIMLFTCRKARSCIHNGSCFELSRGPASPQLHRMGIPFGVHPYQQGWTAERNGGELGQNRDQLNQLRQVHWLSIQ